jgi:hypothetical protein
MADRCNCCMVTVDDKVGILADVADKLKEAGINILAICAWTEGDTGKLLACTDDDEKACEIFKEFGDCGWMDVLCVEADNQPGGLGDVARKLADAGINIDIVFATVTDGPKARVVLKTTDNAKAAELI